MLVFMEEKFGTTILTLIAPHHVVPVVSAYENKVLFI